MCLLESSFGLRYNSGLKRNSPNQLLYSRKEVHSRNTVTPIMDGLKVSYQKCIRQNKRYTLFDCMRHPIASKAGVCITHNATQPLKSAFRIDQMTCSFLWGHKKGFVLLIPRMSQCSPGPVNTLWCLKLAELSFKSIFKTLWHVFCLGKKKKKNSGIGYR